MSVEMVFTEATATDGARRNADAFGTAIQRWNDQLGINHEVQLALVDTPDPDENLEGVQLKDDDGYYSGIYISATAAEAMSEPEIEAAAARVAVSAMLLSLTAERDPALGIETGDLIDRVSDLIVQAFIGS